MLLRWAEEADFPAIGALHRRSRTDAYAGLVSPAGLAAGSAEAMAEWWAERQRWERDTHRLTVAQSAGRLTGFSYLGPSETPGAVELYAIHVEPDLVGTGVGRELMTRALADLAQVARDSTADDQEVTRAVLWVLTANARARRFYARGGWTADGAERASAIGLETTPQVRYAHVLPRQTMDCW